MEKSLRFETLQLHAGQSSDPATKAMAVPIYQTAAYTFDSAAYAEDLFALKQPGNIYTRIMNPTLQVFEERMSALEGGVGALAVASGSAAITYAIMNLASCGDHVVAAATLYGGTLTLLTSLLPKFGITATLADGDDISSFEAAIQKNTKAIFIETIGNPNANLIDIEALAKLAHNNGIPLIVDNTFGTPYLIRPFEYGADIVVHSATKFIGGHGTSIGGVVVDGGSFDWSASGRFPDFTKPDPGYHGIRYAQDIGAAAFITKLRVVLLRDTGACMSPFNAFLFLTGLETLSLRVQRHVENAKKIAEFLNAHQHVAYVNYPSLPGNKYFPLAERYFPGGAGSIFTVSLRGGKEKALAFLDNLKLFSHLANVADAKSLVIHPATTTHGQLGPDALKQAGVTEDMLRLSIGLEHSDDLLDDLSQAFALAYR